MGRVGESQAPLKYDRRTWGSTFLAWDDFAPVAPFIGVLYCVELRTPADGTSERIVFGEYEEGWAQSSLC